MAAGRLDPAARVHTAFMKNQASRVRALLRRHPDLRGRVNDPLGPFDSPLITLVKSRRMLDVLLEAGADINARSRWWAGGLGLLDNAEAGLAAYALGRGAVLTVHAAARLGMMTELRQMLEAKPACVAER